MIPQDLGKHIAESVERMLMGGLYDHVKGGIHRYSTDTKFMVPHFPRVSTSNWADEVEEEEDEGGQSYEEVLDQE
jgi:hypothetical protein